MSNLAIIPARGGSKRIPRKNVKDFLGKPIIAYSIETALGCELFEEVMVSTEDKEIADIAKQYGASVPFFRSEENASDYATTVEVLVEVIDDFSKEKKAFENICCIYPTAPFVSVEDLKEGFKLLKSADSALPVVEFDFPIMRAFQKDDNHDINYVWPEHEFTRSQDLDTYYHDAGQWYWIKCQILKKYKSLITPNTKALKKRRITVQDIDTAEDWRIAELKYSLLNER